MPVAQDSGRCRGCSTPSSPPPQTGGGSLSSNNPDRVGGLCLLSSGLRTLPPTHPTLRPLPNRGGREEVHTNPLDRPRGSRIRLLGPGSGRWDPGLRLPGSAPSCACAGTVHYANCAAPSPGSEPCAAPGVQSFENGRELRR